MNENISIYILQDIKISLYSKEWYNNTLRKIRKYKKITKLKYTNKYHSNNERTFYLKMLKFLNKLENLVKTYKLSDSRKLLNQKLNILNGNTTKYKQLFSKLKNLKYIINNYFNFSVLFQEPNYNLSKDDIEELFFYLEHDEIIEKTKFKTKLITQINKLKDKS